MLDNAGIKLDVSKLLTLDHEEIEKTLSQALSEVNMKNVKNIPNAADFMKMNNLEKRDVLRDSVSNVKPLDIKSILGYSDTYKGYGDQILQGNIALTENLSEEEQNRIDLLNDEVTAT